jgi:predicted ATPase/anti-anti-sigma regulatory factor/GAF domain-containing protein/tRNA A-37 threonylcarbamoyl transferase component Bud32
MIALPHYTLTGTIYEDDIDALYSGQRDADGAKVAVKVLRGEYPCPRDVARIQHEYAILKALSIPGVVRAHALEPCEGGPALILDHVRGRSLHDILAVERIDLAAALRIASSLADTLAAIHAHHVLHKDINPRNIIVDQEARRVTIIAFGIATRLSQETPIAESPPVLEGTLAYISPEQTGRMNRVIDSRTDLYSLGVTLYEILTSALPFPEKDPMDLIHSHIARTPMRPSQLVPSIPVVVSDIVMKLLEKAAEDRYQNAEGLKADLDVCLAELEQKGSIAPFPLGRRDRARDLRIPQQLYGREAELAALHAAFDRASLGAVELLVVKGHAGVGKSALVSEVHPLIACRGGFFGAGQFEQLGGGVPYAGVAAALSAVLRQILTFSPAKLARYRALFEEALGSSGRLLVDLLPELALCIDPQSAALTPSPAAAAPRFDLALQRLLRALSTERTLVIFLDDLHWADAASLSLLHRLLTDTGGAHLLLIGAYRDDEVDAAHPLTRLLGALGPTGAAVTEIPLGPLPRTHVTALLQDALFSDEAGVSPLAAQVFEKTHGNPFFLGQFLFALHREGMLALDVATGRWTWDLPRIKAAEITDNVVALLIGKIKQLSPRTQRVLALAACIGRSFDQKRLAAVDEAEPKAAASDLWEALEEGLVLPLDADYRFFEAEAALPGADASALNVGYRFSHERVQQAAASLFDEAHKQQIHLRIGRLLRAEIGADPSGEALLGAVNHLNFGAAQIDDPTERARLARDNLEAGRKAKARMAYEAATDYLEAGISLLDEAAWAEDRAFASALVVEQATCAYLAGRFEQAEAAYDELLRRAPTDVERAFVESTRITLYFTMGRYHDAIAVGRNGLGRLGIELPETEEAMRALLDEEIAAVDQNLGGRKIEALLDAPVITDPRERAIVKLLMDLWTPTAVVMPTLRTLVTVKQVNFSLLHGNAEASSLGYMAYGSLLARIIGRFDDARAFGRLAMALHERFGSSQLSGSLNFLFGGYAHLVDPLHAAVPYLERAFHLGLETGDFVGSSYAAMFLVPIWMSMGAGLASVEEKATELIALLRRRTWDEFLFAGLSLSERILLNLTGRTDGPETLSGGGFDEARFAESMSRVGFEYIACWYAAFKLMLGFLYEDYRGAIEMAEQAEAKLGSARGSYLLTELNMFAFFSFAALLPTATPEEAARFALELDRHQAQLTLWAEHCPANYQHRILLVRAERARLEGKDLSAMQLYDQAIEAARAGDFLRDEAIASELAARFYLSRGRTRIGRAYLTDARHGYLRWGSTAKVEALDAAYGELLGLLDPRSSLAGPISSGHEARRASSSVDVLSVVRAAQAIAGEILLDKVLDRLLRIILSNAGAQRGVLLLEQDGRLRVEATITLQPDEVRVGPSLPLEEAGGALAVSIAQYVERTSESVVIGDAQRDARFRADPYLAKAEPRSILCLAMAHHGRLMGVLYLENNAVADAFTSARIEICRLLSSQAAVAVENALLYTHVQTVTEQLWATNEHLEREVHRRTEQLRVELAERVRIEEARVVLQEEIIRVQNERLVELSTPLIPISAKVMVMPLIGSIDAERAQQILETALRGASDNGAKVVIMDITGVRRMDAAVAASLMRTAGALGLLGAEAVITGIRPGVAKTLVGLGISLGAVVTRRTLQSGIDYALARTGARLTPMGREAARARAR